MSAKLKTINADEAAYEGFRQLAKECGLTSPELVSAMVQYFRVTKADPRSPTGPDLTTSLAKLTAKVADLDKRTIAFIREQEKTYLRPILAEVQAHKVLSTPAPSAPNDSNELSTEQVNEACYWLMHVFNHRMLPSRLNPTFLGRELPPLPEKGKEDPTLKGLKAGLLSVLKMVLHPDLMHPPKPAAEIAPSAASTSHKPA